MPPSSRRPRKRFGQHFLHDQNVIRRIIESLDPLPGSRTIEIGPGRGALTGPLLETVDALEVIEIDRDLAAELEERFGGSGKLTVHCTNVLKFDFRAGDERPVRIVGNLPYNISTPLLFYLLGNLEYIDIMVLMLQKEVAARICAGPGNKEYGRLSVNVQAWCETERLFNVGSGAFTPAPKVDSAVLRLRPLGAAAPDIPDRELFARLVGAAFGKRRKTLRNSLKGLMTAEDMDAAGITPDSRPEELSVEDFARLAYHLNEVGRTPDSCG